MRLIFAIAFIWAAFVVGRAYESKAPLQKGVRIVTHTASSAAEAAGLIFRQVSE